MIAVKYQTSSLCLISHSYTIMTDSLKTQSYSTIVSFLSHSCFKSTISHFHIFHITSYIFLLPLTVFLSHSLDSSSAFKTTLTIAIEVYSYSQPPSIYHLSMIDSHLFSISYLD